MKREIPRIQPVYNCVKVRENYRDSKGNLYWCWFNPKDKQIAEDMRLKIHAYDMKLVSRIYYNSENKTIFTEVF